MRKSLSAMVGLSAFFAATAKNAVDPAPLGQTYTLKIPPRMTFRSRPPVRVKPSFPPDWVQAEKLAAAEAKRARKAAKRAAERKGEGSEPPENCRQRLAAEGKPYPKSTCASCGTLSPKHAECDALLAAKRAAQAKGGAE